MGGQIVSLPPPNQDFDLQESRFEEKEAQRSRTISLKGF
jgi:hypothetical protein